MRLTTITGWPGGKTLLAVTEEDWPKNITKENTKEGEVVAVRSRALSFGRPQVQQVVKRGAL